MAEEAQKKQKLGLAPSSKEQKALNKVAKSQEKNQKSRDLKDEIMGMFNGMGNGVMPTMANLGNVANRARHQIGDYVSDIGSQIGEFLPGMDAHTSDRRTVQSHCSRKNRHPSESKEDYLLETQQPLNTAKSSTLLKTQIK